MSKYELLTLYGLKELSSRNEIYSPSGNSMIVINNGILGGQLFYDHKAKKVYGLCLKEIPITDQDNDFLNGEYAQSLIPYNMSYSEAIEYLKKKGKWHD